MIKSILPTAAKVLTTLFASSAIIAPIAWKYVPKTQETSEVTPEAPSVDTPSTKEELGSTVEDSASGETNSQTEQKESSENVKVEKSQDKKIAENQKDRYEEIKKKLEEYIEKFKDYENYISLKNENKIKDCLKKTNREAPTFIAEVKVSLETYEKIKNIKKELDESTDIDETLLNKLDKSYNDNISEHTSEEDGSENSSKQKTIEEMINQYKFTKEDLNKCISESSASK